MLKCQTLNLLASRRDVLLKRLALAHGMKPAYHQKPHRGDRYYLDFLLEIVPRVSVRCSSESSRRNAIRSLTI